MACRAGVAYRVGSSLYLGLTNRCNSTALIDGGFNLDDTQFTKRIFLNVRSSLNVPSDAKIEPFVLPEVEEETLPEAPPEESVEAAEGAASEGATTEPEGAAKTAEL